MAGPLEPALADAYRSFFFDIEAFADEVAKIAADAERVVEIGCGEGALISAMAKRLSGTAFLGLDVVPTVGRLFDGDKSRVKFLCMDAEDVASSESGSADLVLICDVMHHVPPDERSRVWAAALAMVKPGGLIVFKEWVRTRTPIYGIGYASDRYITGDRIQYQSREEWIEAMRSHVPGWHVQRELSLKPWRCNHAFVLSRAAGAMA